MSANGRPKELSNEESQNSAPLSLPHENSQDKIFQFDRSRMNSSNRKTTDYYRSKNQKGNNDQSTGKNSQTKIGDSTFHKRDNTNGNSYNDRLSVTSSKIEEPQISLEDLLNTCDKPPVQ